MAKDILGEAGLHFDELNKLRVLDPEVTQQTIELKEECKEFVDKIGQFQKIVGGLIELVDQLAKEAENEKMKAIGARNLLKSIAKQREAQQQQLQALIAEKKMQLERACFLRKKEIFPIIYQPLKKAYVAAGKKGS
uniref:intraflagellar transport protein 20 homolog isoform X1 n=1 Tax=Ictidomys tridecemlineatus TaxID=43179 RepID=UPI001A9D4B66|nr:intraflagellar transport protein 20 homolog isoform X1 [Ictidomys tridecemlineatus]XP_040125102.1 intraflagellar transport protein 20 homolog isoform X1 [Ictidomys tridecemlineatus]XP_040125103.1 intraflagellar transport protein 20 homolog isoform X1 [Ictidomys tridecemlineatus]XP_040125104.1 intraflagellar transport protein 20 homolog isoform X1 [Ictidomys tridecemlineatus]